MASPFQPFRLPDFDREGEPEPTTTLPQPAFATGKTAGQGPERGFEDDPLRTAPRVQTDFADLKFQRENTLLTNAERYAASIREEAELYVRQIRAEVESLNHQAEDRYEEARHAQDQAVHQAKLIVEEAQRKSGEIRDQAYQEGFERGRAEGLTKRYEEAGIHLERLGKILAELRAFRRRVAFYAEKDGVRLALLMAKKILRQELRINRKAVLALLASSLAQLQGKGSFQVWLSPDDLEFVTAAQPRLKRFLDADQVMALRSKAELAPGNVLIETDHEMIDLTFETQFRHLENLLGQRLAERETLAESPEADHVDQPGQPAAALAESQSEATPDDEG